MSDGIAAAGERGSADERVSTRERRATGRGVPALPLRPAPTASAVAGRVVASWRCWLLGAVLVAAILLAYQPAWDAGFIWDDDFYVTGNELLTAPDGLRRIWFSTDSPSQYFPLVYTNFRAQHALWGFDPRGYHWVNLLLHVANALLVWRLLARLAVPGAWLGAAIFALHPLQVESVAWITELKNVQSLFFSLLVLLAWERCTADDRPKWHGRPAHDPAGRTDIPVRPKTVQDGQESPSSPACTRQFPFWRLYAAALVCHALALFSKTTACTLPAGLVLILWIRRQPLTLARWAQIAPFVVMGFIMGLVSIWWERHEQGTVGEEFSYGAVERLLIAGRALSFYLGKFLWPENLTFSYPLWSIDARSPAAWAWLALFGGVAAVAYALRRRLGRGPEVALVFFAATLLPLLGFFMLYTFRYTFVADHYVYVALIGLAAVVGAGAARLAPRLRAWHAALPATLAGLLVLGLATLTWRQSRMYHDLRTLWTTTIARNPASFMAHNNLGALELREGNVAAAIASFERALALKPDHTHALANLANALLTRGRPAEALALFRRVIEVAPADAKGHSDLGQALVETGAVTEAEPHLRRALALDPTLAEAHFLLGRWLLQAGRASEADPALERAVALQPAYAEAHYHLGLVRLAEERAAAAESCFQRTVELAPAHASALNNLATLRVQSGRAAESIDLYRRALAVRPADVGTQHNLALALLTLDRAEEAQLALRAALRVDPDFTPARLDLAQVLIGLRRFDEAAATLELHLARHPGDFDARHGLGQVLLAAGRTDEAVAAFRRVLADSPEHAEARAALAELGRREVSPAGVGPVTPSLSLPLPPPLLRAP